MCNDNTHSEFAVIVRPVTITVKRKEIYSGEREHLLSLTVAGAGLALQPQDSGNSLGVVDLSPHDHRNRQREWNERNFNDFISFRPSWTQLETTSQVKRHGLGDEPGAGPEAQNALPAPGRVAGFFLQLTFGRLKFRFAVVDAAGWNFVEKTSG